MDNSRNNNRLILIIIGVIGTIILCCLSSLFATFIFVRASTINTIKTNNAYLYSPTEPFPSTFISITTTPTSMKAPIDQESVKSFTKNLMSSLKEKGSKNVYDNFLSKNLKETTSETLFTSVFDRLKDYVSYKIVNITNFDGNIELVSIEILNKDNSSTLLGISISSNNGKLEVVDFSGKSF